MPELVSLAENVWTVERPYKFPGVHLSVRMTVVRLPDGKLWVHSPIILDDELAAALGGLGKVGYLVAPNRWHNLWLGPASARYPEARVFGAPGLREKIPSLRIDEVLSAEPPAAWAGTMDQVLVEGAPEMSEVVFIHRPSKTLVVCDLLFNVVKPKGLGTKFFLTVMGTRGKLARSRAWYYMTKNRAAFKASVGKVLAFDFDRLIMAHGDVVPEGAKPGVTRILGT